MRIGGKYNWKGQPERLIYLGIRRYPGNGFWFQFAKVDEPDKVWCEVREAELDMFEETVEPAEDLTVRKLASPSEIEVWNAAVEARKAAKKARKAKKEDECFALAA